MTRAFSFWALIVFALLPAVAATAEPIKLKLAFFSSDREMMYLELVKPFVDAVNAEATHALEIEPHTSGTLGGRALAQQAQMVRTGVADIAFANPNLAPDLFPDDAVMQMPGLFKDTREAAIVYTRLATSGALHGYDDFVVIGAIALLPMVISSRPPTASLDDLKGKKVRATGQTEAGVLRLLGMVPMQMPPNEITSAISSGTVDASAMALGSLFDFGVSRVTSYHYFAPLGAVPLTVLMNRKKFESLSPAAQNVVREYGGEWLAKRYSAADEKSNFARIEQMKADPMRHLIFPTKSELDTFSAASALEIEKWLALRPHNRDLLTQVKAEITKLRNEEN